MRPAALAALTLALASPAAAQTVTCQATGRPMAKPECDAVDALQGRVQGALSRFQAPDPMRPGERATLELQVRPSGAPSAPGVLTAELKGDGFEVSPRGPRRRDIPASGAAAWRWEVKAPDAGRRSLTLTASLDGAGVQLSSTVRRQWVTVAQTPMTPLQRLQALPQGLKLALVVLLGLGALLLARTAVKLTLGRNGKT